MRLTASTFVLAVLLVIPVWIFFVPLFPIEAVQPDFQSVSHYVTVQGTQTTTETLVALPPTDESLGSFSFCFWGHGALLQEDGRYYPLTQPIMKVEGAFCPAESFSNG
jgi:hypothetical protein